MEKNNRSMNKSMEKNKACKTNAKMNMTERAREGSSDVLGSYTGVPLTEDKQPVQDADDL